MQTAAIKLLKKTAMAFCAGIALNAHAVTVSLNPNETADYGFRWESGLGYATKTFEITASEPSWLPVFITDLKEGGDEFALWIDGAKRAWDEQRYNETGNFTANAFATLETGKHTISIEITKLARGYTRGDATVQFGNLVSAPAPVPEPESYAMFAAGLAVLGAAARRRKSK